MKKLQLEIDKDNGWKICTYCLEKKDLYNFRFDKKVLRFTTFCKDCKNNHSKSQRKLKVFEREGILYRICSKCNVEKSIDLFFKDNRKNNITQCSCKECHKKDSKNWEKKNKAKMKKYHKKYRLKNREKSLVRCKKWRLDNKWYFIDYYKNPNNIQRRKKWYNRWIKEQFKNKTNFSISMKLRNNIGTCLRKSKDKIYKSNSSLKLTGLNSWREFRNYIESLWLLGMTWENYGKGKGKWEFDHIIPCRAFDLSKPEEQLKCFNYKNLQPMWSIDNNRKLDRLPNGKLARNIKH